MASIYFVILFPLCRLLPNLLIWQGSDGKEAGFVECALTWCQTNEWRKLKKRNERCNLPKMVQRDPWKKAKTMQHRATTSKIPCQNVQAILLRCVSHEEKDCTLASFHPRDLQHSTNSKVLFDIAGHVNVFWVWVGAKFTLLCIIRFDLISRLYRLYLRTWVVDMKCSFLNPARFRCWCECVPIILFGMCCFLHFLNTEIMNSSYCISWH